MIYKDGLKGTFNEYIKKQQENSIYLKPSLSYFERIIGQGKRLCIYQESRRYNYQLEESNSIASALYFKFDFHKSNNLLNQFDYINLLETNSSNSFWVFKNILQQTTYKVKLKGFRKALLDFITISEEFIIEFFDSEDKLTAVFTYNNRDGLTGQMNGKEFHVVYMPVYHCSEFFVNNKIVGIIYEPAIPRFLYLSDDYEEDSLGDFFNIVFVYDFALRLKDELAEKVQEDLHT